MVDKQKHQLFLVGYDISNDEDRQAVYNFLNDEFDSKWLSDSCFIVCTDASAQTIYGILSGIVRLGEEDYMHITPVSDVPTGYRLPSMNIWHHLCKQK